MKQEFAETPHDAGDDPRGARNVVLIGMPAVGKSTIGVLLAKSLSWDFLDTDVYIQARERQPLRVLLDREGLRGFRAMEERYVLALACRQHVIATGGSVVYGTAAMRHLKRNGSVIYLSLPLGTLARRLTDIDTRGVVMAPGQSLEELFRERDPLYRRFADATVDCAGKSHEQVVSALLEAMRIRRAGGLRAR